MTKSSNGAIGRRGFVVGSAALAAGLSLMTTRAFAQQSELRVAWWGGADRARKFDAIFAAWNADHPDVAIVPEGAEWGAYWDRFATQSIGGTLPDVLGMTERQVTSYNQLLLDLQPYIDDGRLDLSAYDPLFIDVGKVGGKFTMLCTGATIPSLIYNTAHFEAAGLDAPDNWSYDDFRKAAIALSALDEGPEWGASDDGGQPLMFDTFLRQRGKLLFAETGLGFEADDWAEWLTIWEAMRRDGATPPADVSAETYAVPQSDNLIAKGRVSMLLQNHNQLMTFQRYIDDKLDVALLPIRAGGEAKALLAGTYWSLPQTTANPDLSVEFLNFFINDDRAILAYAAELGALPSSYGAKVLEPALDEVGRRLAAFAESAFKVGVISGPRNPGALQAESLVQRANQDVASGRATPESAARDYFAQANGMMI